MPRKCYRVRRSPDSPRGTEEVDEPGRRLGKPAGASKRRPGPRALRNCLDRDGEEEARVLALDPEENRLAFPCLSTVS